MKILKISVMLFCLSAILFFYGCTRSVPKFNTLRDIDCFIEKDRINPKYSKFEVLFSMGNMGDPEPMTSDAGAVAHVIISPVGGTLRALSKKPFKNAKKLFMRGTVQTTPRYVTLYRNESGKPVKDIGTAAIEMAGEKPTSPCCIFTGVKVAASPMYNTEFQDENSHLIATKFIRVVVGFNVKDEFKGPLKDDDWKPFADYTKKVGNIIKTIIDEDIRNRSPYCPDPI